MNAKTAQTYLPCCRPGSSKDPVLVKAARVAEKDSELRRRLREQEEFDAQIMSAIRYIQPPENLRKKLAELGAKSVAPPTFRQQLGHPAMLSAVAGVLLMAGFLIHSEMNRSAGFPGKEAVERMIAMTDEMSGVELEPTQAMAGDLGDAMYIRGFEGFVLPPELARMPAVGWRVFKQNARPVAQVAVDVHSMLIYNFRASELGVQLKNGDDWRVFQHDGWVGAIAQNQGVCTMVAFRGTRQEMQQLLKSLKR